MSELIAVSFDTQEKAFEARAVFAHLQREYVIDMEDIVVVTRNEKGKIKLHQAVNLPLSGGINGAFWGMLVGFLFLNPLLGMAIGAGAGSIGGALTDLGIDDDFMKSLGESLPSNSSALFVLLRHATYDRLFDHLKGMEGKVIRTSMTKSNEDELREILEKHNLMSPDTTEQLA
jgi:uncharacterized membrane protein